MITTVGFTTRNRPSALLSCVQSHIDNARAFDRNPKFLIVDDAVPGLHASASSVVEVLRNKNPGVELHYFGFEEKRNMIDKLAARGLPRELLDFALADPEATGYTLGANRNALQLATLNEHVLFVDDDSLAEPSRPPEWDDRLIVLGPGSTVEYWFYPDHATVRKQIHPEPVSLLGLHETFLGRSCASVLDDAEQTGSPTQGDPVWQSHLQAKGRIKITQNGMAGDCCMFSNLGHLLHGGRGTLDRLQSDKRVLFWALNSRELIRAPWAPTLRMSGLLIGPLYGCDHTEPMPPYFPVYRSSDSTFSNTLTAVFPHYIFADLPWIIEHDAREPRSYNRRGTSEPWHCSVGEIVRSMLFTSAEGLYYSFTDPLGAKGSQLVRLGSLPFDDFVQLVRIQVDEMIEMKRARLSKILESSEHPPQFYVETVQRSHELLKESLTQEERLLPLELRPCFTVSEALKKTQRLVRRFGELMQNWSAISSEAHRLFADKEMSWPSGLGSA